MLSTIQIINSLLAIFCFASFAWSIRSFFKSEDRLHLHMQCIQYLGTLAVISHFSFVLTNPKPELFNEMVSCVLFSLSGILFWMTIHANRKKPLTLAYSNDKPLHLNQTGPYKFIRHPFYTSYTLCWLGCLCSSWNHPFILILVVILAGIILLYINAAHQEELKFINSPLRAAYKNYQKQTGQFFPNLFKIR